MVTKAEASKFEYLGWTIVLTGDGPETAFVGRSDIYQAAVHRYRVTLFGPVTDKPSFFKKLAGMAMSYIDECVANLVQRNATLTSAFLSANPNADALLSRLIYVSWSPEHINADLPDILLQSRRNNAREGITGALCFLKGVYMQYLEGPTAAVEALWQKIEVDDRHHMPKLLERCLVTERLFEDWKMAVVRSDDACEGILRTHAQDDAQDLYEIQSKAAAALFHKLTLAECWIPV